LTRSNLRRYDPPLALVDPLREQLPSKSDSEPLTRIRAIFRIPRFSSFRIAALAIGAALTVTAWAPRPARATEPDTTFVLRMSVPQAIEQLKLGKIVLVDVRPLPQRSLGHVRDDLSMPFDAPAAPGALPKGTRPVFYCSCPAEELALDVARRTMKEGRADVAVLVGGYDAWRAAGAPIAVDASWEETFRVDASPSAWGKTPLDGARYARDTTVAYRGSSSGRVSFTGDSTARGLSGFIQRVSAIGIAGRTITMSAMVRSKDVAVASFLWIGAEDSNGRMISMTRADREPIRGTNDWRAAAVTGAIPSDAARLVFGLSLAGPGEVWIDEVRVVAGEEGGMRSVRLVVENAGFEE
jgi:rhodanese-related sulfurtransferase